MPNCLTGRMIYKVKYSEAVWDTCSIIRIFCAKLDGRCANLRIDRHIWVKKIYDELQNRTVNDIIKEHYNDRGEIITDNDEAMAILNSIQIGSLIFQVKPISNIDICNIEKEFKLHEGELWVVAYAINMKCHDITIIIDDGPALNEICGRFNDEKHHFEIWTSLHVIYELTLNLKCITYKMGKELFNKFYMSLSKKLESRTKEFLNLETMRVELLQKNSVKRKRLDTKNFDMIYTSTDEGNPHWTYKNLNPDSSKNNR